MTTKLIGVKDFRNNLATYTRQTKERGIRFIVLKKNVPLFEVRPISNQNSSLERLISHVANARTDVRRGRVSSLQTVMKDFGLT